MESCDIFPEARFLDSREQLATTRRPEDALGKENTGLVPSTCADLLRLLAGYASAKLLEQRQWEPVVMPMRKRAPSDRATAWNARIEGFNECLDQVERLGPLYSIGDDRELERLSEVLDNHLHVICDQRAELEALRVQLLEKDALLRDVGSRHWPTMDFGPSTDLVTQTQALSSCADSSAPVAARFREHFEKILPVPVGIIWSEADQNYEKTKLSCSPMSHLAAYQNAWRAWCARGDLDHQASRGLGGAV